MITYSKTMDFGIKITGFDEIQKKLDDMIKSLEPKGFMEWADKVEKETKNLCNDPETKRFKFKASHSMKIDIGIEDKEAGNNMIKAIEKLVPSMPLGIQQFYKEGVIPQIETLIKQLES